MSSSLSHILPPTTADSLLRIIIIRFYFSFKDTHSLYMCMDLAPGGELLHYIVRLRKENEEKEIEHTALSVESSRFYASEIVCALEYLHRMEIIHRDLKPESK